MDKQSQIKMIFDHYFKHILIIFKIKKPQVLRLRGIYSLPEGANKPINYSRSKSKSFFEWINASISTFPLST